MVRNCPEDYKIVWRRPNASVSAVCQKLRNLKGALSRSEIVYLERHNLSWYLPKKGCFIFWSLFIFTKKYLYLIEQLALILCKRHSNNFKLCGEQWKQWQLGHAAFCSFPRRLSESISLGVTSCILYTDSLIDCWTVHKIWICFLGAASCFLCTDSFPHLLVLAGVESAALGLRSFKLLAFYPNCQTSQVVQSGAG